MALADMSNTQALVLGLSVLLVTVASAIAMVAAVIMIVRRFRSRPAGDPSQVEPAHDDQPRLTR